VKKTILLTLITLVLLFPPLSLYFAMRSTAALHNAEQRTGRDKSIRADMSQIERLSDESNYLIREQAGLCREFRMMGEKTFKERVCDPAFIAALKAKLKDITEKAGFPCEIRLGLVGADNRLENIHAGSEIGLNQITGFLGSSKIEGHASLKFYKNFLNDIVLNKNTKLVIRNPGKNLSLSGEKLFEDSYILALADLSGFSLRQNVKWRLARFPTRNHGIGAYFPETGDFFFSDYFSELNDLKSSVIKALKGSRRLPQKINLGGHQMSLKRYNEFKKCLFFSVSPALSEKIKLPRQGLLWLIVISLTACALFRIVAEKIILGRGPDISLKLMIPGVFLFLIIQPIFASAYLAGEFFRVSYANEKNRRIDKLDLDLQSLDRAAFDESAETLNLARGLNSIERIEKFANRNYCGDDEAFTINFMNKLGRIYGGNRFSSIWISKHDNTIIGVKADPTGKTFAPANADNMVAEMFKKRFLEIMSRRPGYSGLMPDYSENGLKNELKQEISRDFFLKIFGADAFYNFRRNSGIRIEVNASYRQEQLIANPIDWRNRPHAYAVWYIERENITQNLPQNFLTLNPGSPRIVLHGDEHATLSVKYHVHEIAESHPELLRTGEIAHIARARASSIAETPESTTIYSAIPGTFGNFIMAGSETMSSFEAFRQLMEARVKIFILVMILFGGILAFAGALYFVWPLRELTAATREIFMGSFKVRIHEDHPDEFAALGKAFNNMASGLEEGELLKSFVTDSVRREVEDANSSSLAEKAETTAATVLFAAFCGFSDFQTTHTAEEAFGLLQKLLQAADEATSLFGGEIDKMIEDKVMVVFEHRGENAASCPLRAIQAAAMIADRVTSATGMQVAVGINTGMTVAGIMGAEKARLSRTVVGDPVNLAARLAYEAIKLRGGIVISGQMTDYLPDGFAARKLPISSVKGKTQTIEAFEVIRQEQTT
jgi:class 3 adenylate cyclase